MNDLVRTHTTIDSWEKVNLPCRYWNSQRSGSSISSVVSKIVRVILRQLHIYSEM